MAIIEQQWNYTVDENEDVFIWLSLPIQFDEYGHPTSTTMEAVKYNIMNLCSTEAGERVMQPNLGLRLRTFIFEPFNDNIVDEVQNMIVDSLSYWLPFVVVNDVSVNMSEDVSGDFRNTLEVSIIFSLTQDPTTNDSVQVTIGG